MANCHGMFLEYNQKIRLSDEKRTELITARDNLRERIRNGFGLVSTQLDHHHRLEFQSQGSFVMDTIISPARADYDIDDGIYFIGNLNRPSRPNTSSFHDWVRQSIERGYDDIEKIIDKSTCVRVIYRGRFHVDLPIYYAIEVQSPDLADKEKGWLFSGPVEFIAWFENKIESGFKKAYLYESALVDEYRQWLTDIRKNDVQLRRIVRYLKSWGDLRREEMPCGLVITILAANNYHPHERDDISLKETLVNIYAELSRDFKCQRPTTPVGEDLLKNYKNKDAFMKYLNTFIEHAKKALEEPNQKKACRYWQEILGDRFSCRGALDQVYINTSVSGLASGAATSRPWGS